MLPEPFRKVRPPEPRVTRLTLRSASLLSEIGDASSTGRLSPARYLTSTGSPTRSPYNGGLIDARYGTPRGTAPLLNSDIEGANEFALASRPPHADGYSALLLGLASAEGMCAARSARGLEAVRILNALLEVSRGAFT